MHVTPPHRAATHDPGALERPPSGRAAAGLSAEPSGSDGLRIDHGTLWRGRRAVLAAGALDAPGGSVVALVGGNGAGKTTLLLAAAGVLAPRLGRATVTLGAAPVSAVAYVPQRPALPPWLPVRAAATLHGADADTLLDHAARLGLRAELDRPAHTLSDGQRQALAVAIALARPDPVVLLDEPFSAVDLARRPLLRQMVVERRARQPAGVVVLSSHVATDLAALCDWVVALRAGTYAHQGPTAALAPPDDARAFEARMVELLSDEGVGRRA
jgi:ABC-2 type transport system ATP-binding protein